MTTPKAKRRSPITTYRQLFRRQRQLEKEIDKLTKEKVSIGFQILNLVLNHADVERLHKSK